MIGTWSTFLNNVASFQPVSSIFVGLQKCHVANLRLKLRTLQSVNLTYATAELEVLPQFFYFIKFTRLVSFNLQFQLTFCKFKRVLTCILHSSKQAVSVLVSLLPLGACSEYSL